VIYCFIIHVELRGPILPTSGNVCYQMRDDYHIVKRLKRPFQLFCFLLVLFFSTPLLSDSSYSVVYPTVRAPFKVAVDDTLRGIKEVIPDIEVYGYDQNLPLVPEPIILTNDGIRQYEQNFQKDINPVFGLAEIDLSESIYGVSLFIDPLLYVELIKRVSDDVNRIVFFYNDKKNIAPSIDVSQIAEPVEIVYVSASSSEDALDKFARENSTADAKTAFVFVRGFIELSTNTILDFIVSESWKSNAITVTNKAGFVKAGLTLGLIPDFKAYGRQTALLKLSAEREKYADPRVEYLKTDVSVINIRSAKHSSILVDDRVRSSFKFSYPVD